ncbi:uncharacterized protein LOC144828020 [Lissotriton helveticus]
MAEIQKQAGVTGGGRNPAPPLTELEELVSSTIERESVTGIGTLDSSARATATGAPSGGQTLPKEAAAPSTTALAGPSTSQAAEEEEENTIGLDIEGDLEIDFDALNSPQMQSTPSLQFSPENSPTRELFPPTPAPATVAPVHPVLGAGAQAPASTTPPPVAPQPTQQAGSSSTRRRAIPTTADPAREASVFQGLEGSTSCIPTAQNLVDNIHDIQHTALENLDKDPVFHVSLLKPVTPDTQILAKPASVEVDDEPNDNLCWKEIQTDYHQ